MTGRSSLRARWTAAAYRSPLITDSVRVVLLVLAEQMTEAGYVSVPRTEIADRIGRSPRRVTERLELARVTGFLDVVRRGQPGRTAEYRGLIPTGPAPSYGADGCTTQGCGRAHQEHGADCSTHSVRTGAPSANGQHGADGGPANTRARAGTTSATSPQRQAWCFVIAAKCRTPGKRHRRQQRGARSYSPTQPYLTRSCRAGRTEP